MNLPSDIKSSSIMKSGRPNLQALIDLLMFIFGRKEDSEAFRILDIGVVVAPSEVRNVVSLNQGDVVFSYADSMNNEYKGCITDSNKTGYKVAFQFPSDDKFLIPTCIYKACLTKLSRSQSIAYFEAACEKLQNSSDYDDATWYEYAMNTVAAEKANSPEFADKVKKEEALNNVMDKYHMEVPIKVKDLINNGDDKELNLDIFLN